MRHTWKSYEDWKAHKWTAFAEEKDGDPSIDWCKKCGTMKVARAVMGAQYFIPGAYGGSESAIDEPLCPPRTLPSEVAKKLECRHCHTKEGHLHAADCDGDKRCTMTNQALRCAKWEGHFVKKKEGHLMLPGNHIQPLDNA